ncbi:MAG: DUF4185 domain-containing protein [Longimicrobiales bacterium]
MIRKGIRFPSLISFWACVSVGGCGSVNEEPNYDSPYAKSSVIDTIVFDWSTHRRLAPGSDNWPVTWNMDGQILTAWGDGGGFGGTNDDGRVSLGFAEVVGGRKDYSGRNVWGGFLPERPATFGGKTYGLLAVVNQLYAWISPGSDQVSYGETRLYRSGDSGKSWSDTGVAIEKEDGLIMPAFLNSGRGYDGPRSQHTYIYFIELRTDDSLAVQRPGEIALARAARNRLEDAEAYEWFAGATRGGLPSWTKDIDRREPVFQDSNGVGWCLSVSYNAGLNRYFLITEHVQTKKGNLGLFEAPEPWGPWSTVLYEEGWGGAAGIEQSGFYWNFANPWEEDAGRSVVLVFTGVRENDSWNTVEATVQLKSDR